MRGHDAVTDATGSLAPVRLEVDEVLLLLRPHQLDQAAEARPVLDYDAFLLDSGFHGLG